MGYTIIAPVSKSAEAVYIGIKEFPTEEVFLLCGEDAESLALDVKRDLTKFKIPVTVRVIQGHPWEEIFRIVSEVASTAKQREVVVNVGAGDQTTRCAAISAAFVNGLKAFDVVGKSTMLLPVLKFSYYKLLTEKKLQLLRWLNQEKEGALSFEELSRRARMSAPLLSYHLHGTWKSEGLKQLGLVEIRNLKGKMHILLSTLGRMLIKGYVK